MYIIYSQNQGTELLNIRLSAQPSVLRSTLLTIVQSAIRELFTPIHNELNDIRDGTTICDHLNSHRANNRILELCLSFSFLCSHDLFIRFDL